MIAATRRTPGIASNAAASRSACAADTRPPSRSVSNCASSSMPLAACLRACAWDASVPMASSTG
ncbi:hypothetical protein OZ12_06420 [Xanthomonas translucens pv. translucens]|nr:hypothetical protein OZ12_06420 [Xanthomonas translucens pv. translucens]KWV16712.1 hypothetical protein ATB54_07680 [Xanthomonas translucens]